MPVVTIDKARLRRMMGRTGLKKIVQSLPYLGLDIEGEDAKTIRIEYSPNRPDYSTEYGIAAGLQGILGLRRGAVHVRPRKSAYSIRAEPLVSHIRPYITAVAATGGPLGEAGLKQIISMQEDLHEGISRGRSKSAIGIHDLSKITFPLVYSVTKRTHKFVPLEGKDPIPIKEILEGAGKKYAALLPASGPVPLLSDSAGSTVSFPPVINAASTALTASSSGILVEVTGMQKDDIEDALAVIASTLVAAGFKMHEVRVYGAGNLTPRFAPKKMVFDAAQIRDTLGLELSTGQIASALRRCRLDAVPAGKKIRCTIPRQRLDIFGPADLIEEAALGYGIEKITPVPAMPRAHGQRHEISDLHGRIRSLLLRLGYTEVLNSSLVSRRVLYELPSRSSADMIAVQNPKSLEHEVLRDSLLPGLAQTLSRNIHEPYPQRIFEIGPVFDGGEKTRLCMMAAHSTAGYTEAKSALQAASFMIYGKECSTPAAQNPLFENGTSAHILMDGRCIGAIGEVAHKVGVAFKIRQRMAGFEITLPD